MSDDRQSHDLGGSSRTVEGDEILEVVRDTVQQLELLTERLRTFMEHTEGHL